MAENVEVLKILYEGHQGAVKSLGERSFTTTLQTIGFNIAVVAALVAGKVDLTEQQKNWGTGFLIGFSALVSIYLISKAVSHHGERKQLYELETRLRAAAGPIATARPPSFWRSFIFGSLLFIILIGLATAGTVWWMQTWSPPTNCVTD